MNSKQILVLTVLVVAVGIGGLVMHRKQGESWAGGTKAGDKLLSKLPVGESLAQVLIEKGTNSVTLEKQGEVWRVKERGGYPANFADLSSAILKLRELKPVQIEQIGASQLGRLELLPPGTGSNTATKIEFRDASGKVLETLLLGKTQKRDDKQAAQFGGEDMGGFPVGRWVMVGDAKDKVALVSDPLSNLSPNPSQWLSKDFFKVEKIKSISVTYPDATNSWSVARTNDASNDWILGDAKPDESLDSGKISGFGYALSSPSFNDLIAGTDLEKPTTIAIETFDGFSYTIKAGAKSGEDQPVTVTVGATLPKERKSAADEKPEDKARLDKEFSDRAKTLNEKLSAEQGLEKWTYWVPGWTLDSLLKHRGDLLAEKKSEPATTNAPSLDFISPVAKP